MFRVNESMQFRFNSIITHVQVIVIKNLKSLKSNSLASITEERTNATINRCVVMHAQTLAK